MTQQAEDRQHPQLGIAPSGDPIVGTLPTYAASGGVPIPGQTIWQVGGGGATRVTKGNLTVEVVDRLTSRPIWTGTAMHNLSDHHHERWNQVEKALNKLSAISHPRERPMVVADMRLTH